MTIPPTRNIAAELLAALRLIDRGHTEQGLRMIRELTAALLA